MPDLADLFPGFGSHWASTAAGRIFARTGGSGPPLVLVHGCPQSGAMWHRVAPALARRFSLVIADLRGYGWSSAPASHGGEGYTKRAMGADIVALMEDLGHARFGYVGHDRGARVGYRLALDQPGRIEKLAVLDIIPTEAVWRARAADPSLMIHWPWLARPEPEPETALKQDPDARFTEMMEQWAGPKGLAGFDPRAMAHYRAAWGDPSRIHGICEDYRAGATVDRAADEEDLAAGRTIGCPVLVVAGRTLRTPGGLDPIAVWRRGFAPEASGTLLDCGHFVAEEDPEGTTAALEGFL